MDVFSRLNEFKTLTEKTRTELINLVGKLNKKIEEQDIAYSALLKSKSESDKKHEEELLAINKQVKNHLSRIAELEKQNLELITGNEINLNGIYDIKWNWVDKIVYVLKMADMPLASAEIIKALRKVDTILNSKPDPHKSLSVHLSKAIKYGLIIGSAQKGKVGYLYSLPERMEN